MQNNIYFRKNYQFFFLNRIYSLPINLLVFVRITQQTINKLILIGLGMFRINTEGNSLIMKSSPDLV